MTTGAEINSAVLAFLSREDATIQPNDCTRLHGAYQAVLDSRAYDGSKQIPAHPEAALLLTGQPFILKHDWLSLLGAGFDPWDVQNDFRIPFPMTAFEFLVDGRAVILLCIQKEGDPICMTAVVKWGDAWLFPALANESAEDYPVIQKCWDQVRAACVAMDVGVAIIREEPSPDRLNAKRLRSGQAPIPSLRVVDIAAKHKRTSSKGACEVSKKRLHFRRGHWRHLDDHKTWIKWMLVGDPSLGFVEHHYKL